MPDTSSSSSITRSSSGSVSGAPGVVGLAYSNCEILPHKIYSMPSTMSGDPARKSGLFLIVLLLPLLSCEVQSRGLRGSQDPHSFGSQLGHHGQYALIILLLNMGHFLFFSVISPLADPLTIPRENQARALMNL